MKEDYISKVIKINSYLIPTARCMNFHSALFTNFELILTILLLLFFTALVLVCRVSRLSAIVAGGIAILLLFVVSGRMHVGSEVSMKQMGKIEQMMEKCSREW